MYPSNDDAFRLSRIAARYHPVRKSTRWEDVTNDPEVDIVVIGVLIGVGFSRIIADISADLLKAYVPTSAIITALTVSFLTGIVSGIYPAFKASRLDPVEALRYE